MDKNLQRFYERREIEIQIVDECNLHCKGCNHLACLTKEPWFISLDDFKLTVDLIVKNLSTTIKRLMIVGGEPLLHPQIKEIIQYLDNSVPKNIKVDILTNGII